jgi:hypothetical protein
MLGAQAELERLSGVDDIKNEITDVKKDLSLTSTDLNSDDLMSDNLQPQAPKEPEIVTFEKKKKKKNEKIDTPTEKTESSENSDESLNKKASPYV